MFYFHHNIMEYFVSDRIYMCIDLKSFYASVECIDLGLDPMVTNLVVADKSRSEKTICLAVTPALKKYGISGRPRLFEVMQKVKDINNARFLKIPNKSFTGKSYNILELENNPSLYFTFIAAPPRMAHYIECSTKIYEIYLKYIAPEDIHVYSINEVFMDITSYLSVYKITPYNLAKTIIMDIYKSTGITATAGIGTNLYLAKVAMDIEAKFVSPDEHGVRIAYLDEMLYRHKLWCHTPITDFWRVGKGYAEKLYKNNLFTMGDIARCSLGINNSYHNEELLYKLFGINAELLIDHAWGYEPCTMADIKSYKPDNKSIGSAQMLHFPYTYDKALNALKEMADTLTLDLVDKGFLTNQIVLSIGYDIENMTREDINYNGRIKVDAFGRQKPVSAHGTINLKDYTSSSKVIINAASSLFQDIVDRRLLIRKLSISFNHIILEGSIVFKNLTILDFLQSEEDLKEDDYNNQREKHMQKALLNIKKRYGKNAILRGMNLLEDATGIDRNNQIGGHKA